MATKDIFTVQQAANYIGVSKKTIHRWLSKKILKSYKTPDGWNRIHRHDLDLLKNTGEIVYYGYCRVSTKTQLDDFERQKETIKQYAEDHSYKLKEIFSDIASGMNDNRKNLNKLLEQISHNKQSVVIVTYKDRITRFGYGYIQKYFDLFNCKLEIINSQEIKEDFVKDVLDIITVFCAKLYGKRSSKNKIINKLSEL